MCVMSERDAKPARVGVRELRQNLSVYLDRVKAGETLEVTEHGQPVAQLGPRPPKPMSILDQLIAEGKATPAKGDHRLLRPPPPPPAGYDGPTLSEILQQMRDEDDR
jgi:prevent-host-death family protein